MCVAFLSPAQLHAQRDTTGSIGGVVRSSAGGMVSRASVTVLDVQGPGGGLLGAVSDEAGRFEIARIPAGVHRVRVRALGYRTLERSVQVAGGGRTDLRVTLEATAEQLAEIRTHAKAPEREAFEGQPQVSKVTVSGQTVRQLPVIGEPDVLRVVQLLPGVVAKNDFTAGYNVRGGESDQNLVLLDGIPLYNPFHLGGLFGTFIDETVGDFQLLAGGYPASLGGRLSSVLDVSPAVEPRGGVHGGAGVSVLASSLSLGGTLPDGVTAWSIAGRRTYADKFVAAISDKSLPYHFSDGQAHLQRQLRGGGLLSLTAYSGLDLLDAHISDFGDSTQAGGGHFKFDWGNRLVGGAFRQPVHTPNEGSLLFGDSAIITQRLSWTDFRTTLDLGEGSLVFNNRVGELRAQGSVERHSGMGLTTYGYEYTQHAVRYRINASAAGDLFSLDQRPAASALFVDHQWKPHASVLVRVGARGEHVTGTGWSGLSPRVAVRWYQSKDLALTFAAGQYAQWMHALRNDDVPIRIFDFWVGSDKWVDVSTAKQAVAGVERWLGDARFIRVESYYKRYDRLAEPNPVDDPAVRGDEFLRVDGSSYGFDLYARQLESKRLSGWIAYSYGLSRRNNGEESYYPAHDRRHNLNVVATYHLTGKTLLGARFGYGSALPYTTIIGQLVRRVYDSNTGTWDTGIIGRFREPVGGARNAARYPPVQRLDMSVTHASTWRGMEFTPFFSLVNAYNAKNVFTYVFDYTDNPPTRSALSQFPLLPTVGMGVRW